MSGPRAEGCDAHGRVSEEVRALAELLVERIEPWARRVRDGTVQQDPENDPTPSTCTWCPVCTIVGLLRGERPELAARLAEHAVGLLAAIREALASPPGRAEPATAGDPAGSRRAGVQRIPVRRAGETGGPGGTGC